MKRPSKAEREAAQKAALRQRLYDMARGANGGYSLDFDPDVGIFHEMGPATFGRWLGAIQSVFCADLEYEWGRTIRPCDIADFDSLDKAVEKLWNRGVRS